MKIQLLALLLLTAVACTENYTPKPKAYLRLEYPKAIYQNVKTPLPFSFEKNTITKPINTIKSSRNSRGIDVLYPAMKATLHLTYNPVSSHNLDSLLRDAQSLALKHTIKADEILQTPFENSTKHVYGMLYEIGGNAASQSQFYATDSLNHFLSGSLYFYAKPNYDSIYPAAEYLKKDIRHLMESLNWTQK